MELASGIEPLTTCLQNRCSAGLSYVSKASSGLLFERAGIQHKSETLSRLRTALWNDQGAPSTRIMCAPIDAHSETAWNRETIDEPNHETRRRQR